MLSHADKFSPAFSKESYYKIQNGQISDRDMWKYSSFWYKNFDDMAKKTMLRQLISRWGVMSIEMITAFESDNKEIETTANGDFVSSETEPTETPALNSQPEVTEVEEQVDLNSLD